jgi:hypothetical protein
MLTDYTMRLPNQFQDSTNLKALIKAFADAVGEGNDVLEYLLLQTVDVAEGVWLDEIGEIIGVPRPSQTLTDNDLFAYSSFADFPGVSTRGFSDISDPHGGYYLGLDDNGDPYAPTGVPVSDTDYRVLIHAKVNATHSEDSIPSIYSWIYNTFGATSYVYDVAPCEVAIELDNYLTFYERWVLLKMAPIAAGIRIWIAYNPPYVPPVVIVQYEDEEENQV